MPNPGGPYAGCDACRRRKVKCDQTYPSCLRCQKRDTVCPGVKDWRAQVFKDETQKTAAKLGTCKRREIIESIGPEEKAAVSESRMNSSTKRAILRRPPAADVPTELLLTDAHGQDQQNDSLPAHLRSPPEDSLVAFFFDQITCPDIGWFTYLPGIFRDTADDSYLHASVKAASLFVLANQHHGDVPILATAWCYYGDALHALNQTINDGHERLKDDVVCTILILNVIECITGSGDGTLRAHISGLKQLMRLRRSLGIRSLFGAQVWMAMKSQLLNMRPDNGPPVCPEEYPQVFLTPALKLHQTCEAVRVFRASAERLVPSDVEKPSAMRLLPCIVRTVRNLDSALQAWGNEGSETMLTARWHRYTAPTLLHPDTAITLEFFNSIEAAQIWNQWRCARIHLHEVILRLNTYFLSEGSSSPMPQIPEGFQPILEKSRRVIDEMLDGICGSIPYNLCQIDSIGSRSEHRSQRVVGGAGLVWPLETVLSCPCSSKVHKTLATDALQEIGHLIGVKKALVVLGE